MVELVHFIEGQFYYRRKIHCKETEKNSLFAAASSLLTEKNIWLTYWIAEDNGIFLFS